MTTDFKLLRGDLWIADFGAHPENPEQAFLRPALIVSDDQLHHPKLRIVVVIPGTSTIRSVPLHVIVEPGRDNGLERPTAFQTEQVRAISTTRLVDRIGRPHSGLVQCWAVST